MHDGLNTYEVELTTELLKDLGGKDRYDSSGSPLHTFNSLTEKGLYSINNTAILWTCPLLLYYWFQFLPVVCSYIHLYRKYQWPRHKKPPPPDKREQKDILKRKVGYKKKPSRTESKWSFFSPSCFCYRLVSSGKEGQSDDDCIEIDDDKEGKSIILEMYMLFEKRKHERKRNKCYINKKWRNYYYYYYYACIVYWFYCKDSDDVYTA